MNGILIFFLAASVCFVAAQNAPIVTAPAGRFNGSIMISRLGKEIYSFRGVRYGKPPVNSLRFQPPEQEDDSTILFDASEEGPSCPYPGGLLQEEDCLRLNVYTTKLPSEAEKVTKPVMIFIHPGWFYNLSGQSYLWGPQYMMDKDVVLVTINYRLGALGFLSTEDGSVPGNMGLKDQVLALRWVQRNIGAFGGDPKTITLVGDDAGCISIMLHMVSPMSKDLFQRGICMSAPDMGLNRNFTVLPKGQQHLTAQQARCLNCSSGSTSAMLDCLRSKPFEDFTRTQSSLFDVWNQFPLLLWKPTVEPESSVYERFLPAQPYDLIVKGQFANIPLIFGATQDDIGGMVYLFNETMLQELGENWTTVAPIMFQYEADTTRSNIISNDLRRFYFNNLPILKSNGLSDVHDIFCDGMIMFPTYRAANVLASYSSANVYLYEFTFQGRNSFVTYGDGIATGVNHLDDLQYIFNITQFPPFEPDSPEVQVIDTITSIWANFVKGGVPVSDQMPVWSAYSPTKPFYMDINQVLTLKEGWFVSRMEEWNKLFPLRLNS